MYLLDLDNYLLNTLSLQTLLASLAVLSLGFFALVRDRASYISFSFFLITVCLGVWLFCFSWMYSALTEPVAFAWSRAAYWGVVFLPAAFYQFASLSTGRYSFKRRRIRTAWFLSGVSLLFIINTDVLFATLQKHSWGYYPEYSISGAMLALIYIAIMLLVLKNLWSEYKKTSPDSVEAKRTLAYFVSFACGFPAAIDFLPAFGLALPPVGYLPIVLFIILTFRTIRKYRFVEISSVFATGQIMDSMTDALLILDNEGRIRLANRAAATLFQRSVDDLFGQPFHELPGIDSITITAQDLMSDAGIPAQEFEFFDVQNKRLVFSLSTSPIKDRTGQTASTILIFRDITVSRIIADRIRHSEEKYRSLFEDANDAIFIVDDKFYYLDVNRKATEIFGYSRDEFLKMSILDVIPPEQVTDSAQELMKLRQKKSYQNFTGRMCRKDGSFIEIEVNSSPILENGQYTGSRDIVRDITERHRAEELIIREKNMAQQYFDLAGVMMVVIDTQGIVQRINPRGCEVLGYDQSDVIGKNWFDNYISEAIRTEVKTVFKDLMAGEIEPVEYFENIILTKSGKEKNIAWHNSLLSNESGEITGTLSSGEDITERLVYEQKIKRLAYYDILTGLPNRRLLLEVLNRILARARRREKKVAVLFVDLDGFKQINDSLGHIVGDQLLMNVAERLTGCLRESDLVSHTNLSGDPEGEGPVNISRLGGDEFILILDELETADDISIVTRRMLESISLPYTLSEREVFVTASIGISVFPDNGDDAETLFANSDIAMYHAKKRGRNSHQYFSPDMNERARARLSLENDLRRAIPNQELILFFQPLVDAKEKTIIGLEALLRWNHPTMSLLSPDKFIQMAEETGLILPVGEWVLSQACQKIQECRNTEYAEINIAVNLSNRQFEDERSAAALTDIIRRSDIDPGKLVLEITESVLMENRERSVYFLAEWREMGVSIALDDFGTGYSSLGYLTGIPLDQLKIDRTFIKDMSGEHGNPAIIKAIIAMAHSLQLKVVGEGVELESQAQMLQEYGCDILQGFLFSKPKPWDDLLIPK